MRFILLGTASGLPDGEHNMYGRTPIRPVKRRFSERRYVHSVIARALHPEPARVLKLQYAGIKRVLLNHGLNPALARELFAGLPQNFELAVEGASYEI